MSRKLTNKGSSEVVVKNATSEIFKKGKRTIEEAIAEYTIMYHKSERNSEKAILKSRIEELENQKKGE